MSYTIRDSKTIGDISVVSEDRVEGNAFVIIQLLNLVTNSSRKAYWMKETPEITILVKERILTHPFGNVYAVGDVSLAKKMVTDISDFVDNKLK